MSTDQKSTFWNFNLFCSLKRQKRYLLNLYRGSETWTFFDFIISEIIILSKVHIFWEGLKILRNLRLTFDWHYTQVRWRFQKFLWPSQNIWTLNESCMPGRRFLKQKLNDSPALSKRRGTHGRIPSRRVGHAQHAHRKGCAHPELRRRCVRPANKRSIR